MKDITIHPLIEFRIKTALDNYKNLIFYIEYRNAESELWKTANFYRNKSVAEKKLSELTHKRTLVSAFIKDKPVIAENLKNKIYQKINSKTMSN
ncbi:hypothetical protein [Aquimarina algiphila]|uniref:hypothetical protein n=1 Tax=Aquimarina algiphila TaxID=2047982 RepID=UPI00232F6507|nr:hypothetical protein [Aquimarina algiphila]